MINKSIIVILLFLTTLNSKFIKDSNMIIDTTNNLIWQDDPSVINRKGDWESAINSCNNLSLGGFNWRLPNINELQTIIDYENTNRALNNIFNYLGTHSGFSFYYSSTTYRGITTYSFAVDFSDGRVLQRKKTPDYSSGDKNIYSRCITNR